VAVYGTLQSAPRPGEYYDIHHLIATATLTLPLTADARAARGRIAAAAPAAAQWTPSLVLMFPGYECFPVGPGSAEPAALDTLVGGIVAWARAAGARTVGFLYLRPAAAALAGALTRHGFSPVPLTFSFDLPIPGPDFADYLRALPKKRRVEVGRELRQLAEAGVELHRPRADAVFDELVGLRCALVRKYRGTVDVENERTKVRRIVDEVAGGAAQVFCATADDGTVLSAALFAGSDQDWTCLLSGTDHTDPRSRFCYFATAYYEPVRAAAPLGVRLLRYGQGSWDAKLSRGCRPTPMTGWVLALDPALAPTVRDSAASTEVAL
jgi:predicted N-acyltransferase